MTEQDTIEAIARYLAVLDDEDPDGDYDHPAFPDDSRVWHAYRGKAKLLASLLRPGSRLPGGLVVVPMEPTKAMIKAAM